MSADREVIERVSRMEGYLNECAEATAALSAELDRMNDLSDHMTDLFSYYGSNEWLDDRDAELPADTPAGVLSEDLVYEQVMAVREAAFRMLELGTEILRDRI